MAVDLVMLGVWVAAGLYVWLGYRWRRSHPPYDVADEAEAYLAGYERGKELRAQGLSEEEVQALAQADAKAWARNRRRRSK